MAESGRLANQFVLLTRDGSSPAETQESEQGIWSLTTDLLPPNISSFTIKNDGKSLADPVNTLVKPIVMGGNQGLVHVPDGAALSGKVHDVPRRTLHHHWGKSALACEGRDFYVQSPLGYDPVGKAEHPVLFLPDGIIDDD